MEHKIRQAEKDIETQEQRLDGIAADFTDALELYGECLNACGTPLPKSMPVKSPGQEKEMNTEL